MLLGLTLPDNPNGVSISSAIIAQFTSECRRACRTPQNYPFPRGSVPPCNTWFLGTTQLSIPNGISIGSAIFCTDDRRVSLYCTMGRPFPSQNCPFPWGCGLPSNTWFPEPTRVFNPNSISIGSAVFAGLTTVTDQQTNWQTDRPTDRQTDRQTTLLDR